MAIARVLTEQAAVLGCQTGGLVGKSHGALVPEVISTLLFLIPISKVCTD